MTKTQTDPVLLRDTEAMAILNIGRTTVWQLVWSGQLGSVKIGKTVRIPRSAIDEFIDRQPSAARSARTV